MTAPDWMVKLARRLLALPDGCYVIVLSRDGSKAEWSVLQVGKVEQ